jgi:hypothetical protein
MIVRIATEGQYELDDEDAEALQALDDQTGTACQAGDEEKFNQVFQEMLDVVRTKGKRVPDDELIGSDLILPPPDSTMEEVASDFTGEGLIPD